MGEVIHKIYQPQNIKITNTTICRHQAEEAGLDVQKNIEEGLWDWVDEDDKHDICTTLLGSWYAQFVRNN